jgi:hypothetical protein
MTTQELIKERLRDNLYEHGVGDAEKASARQDLAGYIIGCIEKLGASDVQSLARFADILRIERGNDITPDLDFIVRMVNYPYQLGPLTPDVVARQVDHDNPDGFRANFNDAVDTIRYFQGHHPDLFKEGAK